MVIIMFLFQTHATQIKEEEKKENVHIQQISEKMKDVSFISLEVQFKPSLGEKKIFKDLLKNVEGLINKKYEATFNKSNLQSAAIYIHLSLEYGNEEQKKKALELYNKIRPTLAEQKIDNLPLSYPPSTSVPRTNEQRIKEAQQEASKIKTKPETHEVIIKNLEEIEKGLSEVKEEIEIYVKGDKDRPGTYYISKEWGVRLEKLIKKYYNLIEKYEEYLNKADKNKYSRKEEVFSFKNDLNLYSEYARNSKQIDFYLNDMKSKLRRTNVQNYHIIIEETISKVKPLIKEGSPLERKFKLVGRSYFEQQCNIEKINKNSSLAYLELMLKISKKSEFINSDLITTMEGSKKQNINFGKIDLNSTYNAFKDISIFGKYEMYKHFNGKVPTYGEEFGTLLLGMSIMGYDSSAHVLNKYGSLLYNRFDSEGSLLVMQHIGAATLYAENISDYENLDNYINVDINTGFTQSMIIDEYHARKQAGIKGREASQTVGSPGQGVEESFKEGTTSAKITTYLTLINNNENQSGFYVEKPPNLFDPNLAFSVRIKNMREFMELLNQKVDITASPPVPQSKISLLPVDLSGFGYNRYRGTDLDSLDINLGERLNYEKTEGETITEKTRSTTSGNIQTTGETSSISGKADYTFEEKKEDRTVQSKTDSGSYRIDLENIGGTRGFARGTFDYFDTRETFEIENYLNSTNTFKDSNIILYTNSKKSVTLNEEGKEIDTGKEGVFEIQAFIKTEYGWVHAGTDQIDSNVNSVYGQTLVNLTKESYVESGASGLVFHGNVKDDVLSKLKQGLTLESDFYGTRESEFEGVGGGFQASRFGLGGTYQRIIKGFDRGLIVSSFNGMDVKGWGGIYFNPPQKVVVEKPETTITDKFNIDTTKKAPLIKERQSKSEIFEENLEGIGFREVTFAKFSGGKFMNDAFFQLKDDYKKFYGGLLGRFVLDNGTFMGGAGTYDQKEDEGKGNAYISNKERTKFITAQIVGKNLNLDAVTSGFMYKEIFGWDVNAEGFANYKDEDNTTFGAEFDFINKRITLYGIGGDTTQGSIANNDKHFFTVVGGRFVPFEDTGFSFEGFGLIGEKALGLGPGGFANPQYVGDGWALGLFGGGTKSEYGTVSVYTAFWNKHFSLGVLGTYANLNQKGTLELSGTIKSPAIGGYGPIEIPISTTLEIENKSNIFELGFVSQFYLENSLDLNLSALWSGQFKKENSKANLAILEMGVEKRLSWPYSLEVNNTTILQWIDSEVSNNDIFNAKSNLNLFLRYKDFFNIGVSGGVEHRKSESESKTGATFDLNAGFDF